MGISFLLLLLFLLPIFLPLFLLLLLFVLLLPPFLLFLSLFFFFFLPSCLQKAVRASERRSRAQPLSDTLGEAHSKAPDFIQPQGKWRQTNEQDSTASSLSISRFRRSKVTFIGADRWIDGGTNALFYKDTRMRKWSCVEAHLHIAVFLSIYARGFLVTSTVGQLG